MSWSLSMFVGVLTAIVGLLASGFVANLAVGWYRIPSFEAGSAAFVVMFALLGLVVGFIVGLVTSRVVAGGADPGFLKALGSSQAILLGMVAVVGGSARLLADVPPTIDGEALMLAVEVRWPEGHTESPAALTGEPYLRLGSITRSNTQRASSRGPLYTQDAHLVDGRWVAPGVVDIFTTRGRFVIDVVLDSATNYGFLTPLSGAPGKKNMKWTDWYPRARPGSPPPPNGFTYRYRVQRTSEPVRVETFGPFRIVTIASSFFDQQINGKTRLGTVAEFAIEHDGKPLVIQGTTPDSAGATTPLSRADDISAVAGPHPTLLAHFVGGTSSDTCHLVSDQAGSIQTALLPDCSGNSSVSLLTSDAAVFRAAHEQQTPRGQFDRSKFASPGLYLAGHSVLDTRRLAIHTFALPDDFSLVPSVPPLGVSPDERSFARFGYAEHSEANPVVLVTDAVANHAYMLPIDRARMRFADLDVLDPAWLLHHFAWQRGANGADSLVERKDFVPIPYHGELSVSDTYRAYRLQPAREGLRTALVDFLVAEMKAERLPADSGAYVYPVKINGQTVEIAYGSNPGYVAVSMPTGNTDMTLVQAIARHLDTALATGRYDALFGK
jgi:hypothetical protein